MPSHTSGGGLSAPGGREVLPVRGMFEAEARASTWPTWDTTPTTHPCCLMERPCYRPVEIAPETWVIQDTAGEDQPDRRSAMNSMLIRGAQPVVVDTGVPDADRCFEPAWLVDPADVRWVFVSHDDTSDPLRRVGEPMRPCPDDARHELVPVRAARPGARRRPTRWRWLGDGETLDVGDRTRSAIRPPLCTTRPPPGACSIPSPGVYWARDCYVSGVDRDRVRRRPRPRRVGGRHRRVARWNSPWVDLADADRYAAKSRRIEGAAAAGHRQHARSDDRGQRPGPGPTRSSGPHRRWRPRPSARPGRPRRDKLAALPPRYGVIAGPLPPDPLQPISPIPNRHPPQRKPHVPIHPPHRDADRLCLLAVLSGRPPAGGRRAAMTATPRRRRARRPPPRPTLATAATTTEVGAVDFVRGPALAIDAGTRLTLRNDADRELHELVAPVPRRREAPCGRAAEAARVRAMPMLGAPSTVLPAAPGEDQGRGGRGRQFLTEPGRYP